MTRLNQSVWLLLQLCLVLLICASPSFARTADPPPLALCPHYNVQDDAGASSAPILETDLPSNDRFTRHIQRSKRFARPPRSARPLPILHQVPPAPTVTNKALVSAVSATNDTIEAILMDFYAQSGGNQWVYRSWPTGVPWGSPVPYCKWFGVMCDNNGYIWKIALSDVRLSGFVPRPFVGLVNMTQLDLSTNCMYSVDNTFFDLSHLPLLQLFSIATQWNLIAEIPDSFFDGLPNLLHLDFSWTGVSVSMAQFTRLPNIQGLFIQGISISGKLSDLAPLHSSLVLFDAETAQSPAQTMYDFAGFNALQEIDVTAMVIEGPLPSFNLPMLTYINLQQTALSGPIPPQQLPNLNRAYFDETQLSGAFNPLYNSSQLTDLSLSLTLDLVLNLDEVCTHWPNLKSLALQYSVVQGSLMSLNNCSNLQNLSMEGVGITGDFPPLTNPSLLFIDLSSNELTSLPDTILLPALAHLDLQRNLISGAVPMFTSIATLQYLDLSNNRLNSSLPTFQPLGVTDCSHLPPSLNVLLLNNNEFTGSIPPCYSSFPNLNALSLGFNNLAGPLPKFNTNPSSVLEFILLESNRFTGPLPAFNLSYLQLLSLVNNSLDDSLDFAAREDISLPLLLDARFDNNFFHCPIHFPADSMIMFLSIASNLFNASCASMTFLSTMSRLRSFDGSFNAWNGEALPLILPNEMKTFSCANCGYVAQLPTTWQTLSNLRALFLSGNTIEGRLEQTPFYIVLLDLSNCSLSGDLFASVLYSSTMLVNLAGSNLLTLNLGRNRISGRLSRTLFDKSVPGFSFVGGLQELRVNNNLLTGPLPPASTGWQMQTLDFTGNQFIGEIPESYVNFKELRELRFGNNPGLKATSKNKPLPAFMSASSVFDTAPSTANGFACPTITLTANPTAIVTLDPSYYNYTFCQCVDKFFGHNNLCFPVPDICQAKGKIISGCQPVQVDAQGTFVFLPCPLTIIGQSLCNPNGIDWPAFNVATNDLDLTQWCYKGHEGRVCSKCQQDYFASGRWCVKCLSTGLHYLVFIACALLVPALCIFLYVKAPKVATLIEAISHMQTQQQLKQELSDENTSTVRSKDVDASSALLDASPRGHRFSPELIIAAVKHASMSESNAWKLLLFHTQSLGILLSTQTSLPSVLVTFISVVSSGSGFSFSSLLALECVTEWTLAHKIWASLALPAAVIVIALLLRMLERWHQKQSGLAELDDDTVVITPSALTLFVWKSYGVCWSVLYVLVFPSAQLALSAIGCTDWREGGEDAYLNLFSWIQCDADWRTNILPVALIAVIFWLVIFPLGSTWMLFRLGRQLRKGELQTWSVLGQLCAQYRAKYWNWEQVVLLRRLGLVTILAIVPTYSLYLPLLLFSLIQLSALAQHAIAPYQNAWNHRAELASLYILLINYVTALVLDQNSSNNNSDTSNDGLNINAWAILLLLVNVIYILILVISLSHQLQQKLLHMFRKAYSSTFGDDSIRHSSFGQSLLTDRSINPNDSVSEGKEEDEKDTIALDVRNRSQL